MKSIVNLFTSSIGRKFLMALTGLVLVGFVAGHLVGNLQIFSHPDKINGYAHFLQSLGPALWGVRAFLLLCVAVHAWAGLTLLIESRAARGPEKYGVHKWLQAAFASRYMRLTGLVVLAFIVYHILHFTVGVAQPATFKTQLAVNYGEYTMHEGFHLLGFPIVAAGQHVHDVYSMVFLGFMNPWVSAFYIVAVGLLTLHLLHGIDSLFQTLGWRNHRWSCCLQKLVALFCLAYFLGNLAIPGAIVTGLVKPAPGTTAAQICAAAGPGCCPASHARAPSACPAGHTHAPHADPK
ncbi:MAG: succinate dehydrogenase cytochrome b subunit [Opitutaceae bacterium]|jgi:succinate dehydrogenase / fumarate reductase cytochrome b subunit|nr:succinate dehydrogenase cytochrome b subunit [Opitutaceae bacterium]